MLRYLPGIVLVQIVTVAVWWVIREKPALELLYIAVPLSLGFSILIAFWFSMVSRMDAQKANAELIEKHFQEREKLNQALERTRSDVLQKASADQAKIVERASKEREQLVKQTHQELLKAERRANRGANMKVGAAFTAVTLAGAGLLFVQFMTLGLLTITAASGALGGYVLRWKQTRGMMQLAAERANEKLESPDSDEKDSSKKMPIVINADKSS